MQGLGKEGPEVQFSVLWSLAVLPHVLVQPAHTVPVAIGAADLSDLL